MLRIGIIVVLMILPACPMPVKESEDATIFEDDIIIKAIPETTNPPAAMNVFEDHVFLRKKREPENLPPIADKSSFYGDETHWWKNQKTSVQPVFPNKLENVFEDHFIMNRKPDRESTVAEDNIMMKTDSESNGLSIFEDNVMMRQGNIFEDNIAMKQDEQTQNVFEDNIIMKQKGEEELDQGANLDPASPTSMSVDQVNSVYEDNIMLRKRDASQHLESAGVIEDDIAMREDARQGGDQVMLQNRPYSSSEKVSNVFEDHVIMRKDAETTTESEDKQDATKPKASVFEDNIMMRSGSDNTIDSSSKKDVIEDNLVMREDQEAKGSFVTEDHVMFRTSNGNSETEFGSSSTAEQKNEQSLIVTEDHFLRKRRAANRDAKDSVLEDNVTLQSDNTQSSPGSTDVHEKNNHQSLIVIEDHLIRKRRAANRDAKDSILEDNVMLQNDNTQSSPGSTAVHEKTNQQSSIIIDDHLLRKRRAANRDEEPEAKRSFVTEDHVILSTSNGNSNTGVGSSDMAKEKNQQSLIIIEDHLLRKRRATIRDAKDSILEDTVMLQNDNTKSSPGSAAANEKTDHQSLIVIEDHLLRK